MRNDSSFQILVPRRFRRRRVRVRLRGLPGPLLLHGGADGAGLGAAGCAAAAGVDAAGWLLLWTTKNAPTASAKMATMPMTSGAFPRLGAGGGCGGGGDFFEGFDINKPFYPAARFTLQ